MIGLKKFGIRNFDEDFKEILSWSLMYRLFMQNSKADKNLRKYINSRSDVVEKLDRLRFNPFQEVGAHPLKGKLKGKWSCWLGSNIRMIYRIDVEEKLIIVESVGNHKVY